MNKKRIAELREKHGGWSPHREHHPGGSVSDAALDVIECLDAIEALATRNAELEAMIRRTPTQHIPELMDPSNAMDTDEIFRLYGEARR